MKIPEMITFYLKNIYIFNPLFKKNVAHILSNDVLQTMCNKGYENKFSECIYVDAMLYIMQKG